MHMLGRAHGACASGGAGGGGLCQSRTLGSLSPKCGPVMSRGGARLRNPRGIGPLVVCPGARQNARGVAHGPSRQWKYEGRPQIDRTLDVDLPGFREGSGEGETTGWGKGGGGGGYLHSI